MAHDVIWYSSDEAGAPTLNNAAGSLVAVLDACLVTGFNAKAVTSIALADGVATVTASAHGYMSGRIVEIAGASVSALNGRQRITATGPNTFTFPTAATGAVSGSITSRRPGIGYEVAHTDTAKRIYRRTMVGSYGQMLRVDDSSAGSHARVVQVESATGIETFSDRTPTEAQLAGGQYWSRGVNTGTAKQWHLFGDGRMFYLFSESPTTTYSSIGALIGFGFGDIVSFRAADAYATMLLGSATAGVGGDNPFVGTPGMTSSVGTIGAMLARGYAQTTKSIGSTLSSPASGMYGGANGLPVYPSAVDNGLYVMDRVLCLEGNTTNRAIVRGIVPGLAAPFARLGAGLHASVLVNLLGNGRDYAIMSLTDGSTLGGVLIDITGPWR